MEIVDTQLRIEAASGRPTLTLDTVGTDTDGGTVTFKRQGAEVFDIYLYDGASAKLAIYDASIANDALGVYGGVTTLRALTLGTGVVVPTNSSSPGSVGAVAWDDNFIYMCGSTGVWKRIALNTF